MTPPTTRARLARAARFAPSLRLTIADDFTGTRGRPRWSENQFSVVNEFAIVIVPDALVRRGIIRMRAACRRNGGPDFRCKLRLCLRERRGVALPVRQ